MSKLTTRRRRAGLALALVTALLAALASAAPAMAEFDIAGFDGTVNDQSGEPFTQAGGHPYDATTSFEFTKGANKKIEENLKDVRVDLPPGLVGNPLATTKCSFSDFTVDECSPSAQVGTLTIIRAPSGATATVPVYNMVPRAGIPAQFAANILNVYAVIDASVRTGGDYGLTTTVNGIATGTPIYGISVTFWGVPADPSHDSMRACPGGVAPPWNGGTPCQSGLPLKPFLTLPTACLGPQTTYLNVDTWQEPGDWKAASFVSHDNATPPNPIGVTGCDKVDFTPSITIEPDSSAAGSPSGLSVDLQVPQNENSRGTAEATLKRAVVKLPVGVSVSPAAAGGLAACSSAQIGLDDDSPPSCPDASKIGTVDVTTPLLTNHLTGSVYLAKQHDNPFNSLLAIYVTAETDGVLVKLAGHVVADPTTGQLTTTFDDNPQLPFSDFKLDFFGGARGALVMPERCGTYTTEATLTPWSGTAPVTSRSSFQFTSGPNGGPCPDGSFDPHLSAGTTNPAAGTYSPFVLRLTRDDGTQELAGVTANLPEGLTGRLAGIPYCSDAALAGIPTGEGTGAAQLAAPACPAASQIGTVTVGAGAGTNPFYVDTGKAYLAGPYKGAPLSMAFVTPAVAGPFDLGNVVVRAALRVDQRTAQITAVSDPLPHILHGIPLDLRDVRVNIDRDRFTLNPTSCEPAEIASTITSVGGAQAHPASRFQVGSCGALPFSPRLKLQLKGSTRRAGHPALRAVVTMPAGGANIARAQVGLPRSEFLDQGNLNKVCKQADLHAGTCPKSSIYGWARAWTPLLDQPLQGPVYLGVGFGYKLPALVADLNGQIRILLVGRVDTTRHKGIRNTFEVVPDAPVSRFELRMKGGKKYGLLENSENICAKKRRASALFNAQNGDRLRLRPKIAAGCGKKKAREANRKGHSRAASLLRRAAHRG